MIKYKYWMKQKIDVPLDQYTFENLRMHFEMSCMKGWANAIGVCMYHFALLDVNYDFLQAKEISWNLLSKAAQICETPEDLYALRKNYRELTSSK